MSDHLLAVLACWLVAGCGLAMFVRATSFRGQLSGHAAVCVSLLSLSIMALDHDHREPAELTAIEGGEFVSVASAKDYHVPGCPRLNDRLYFTSASNAAAFDRRPCSTCLLKEANNDPDEQDKHDERAYAGQEIYNLFAPLHRHTPKESYRHN